MSAVSRTSLILWLLAIGAVLSAVPATASAQSKTVHCKPANRGSVTCEAGQNGSCIAEASVITECSRVSGRARAARIIAIVFGPDSTGTDAQLVRYRTQLMRGEWALPSSGHVTFTPFESTELQVNEAPREPVSPQPSILPQTPALKRLCATLEGTEYCTTLRDASSGARSSAIRELERLACGPRPSANCRTRVSAAAVERN